VYHFASELYDGLYARYGGPTAWFERPDSTTLFEDDHLSTTWWSTTSTQERTFTLEGTIE
jgi:hypothetical protein